MNNLSWQYLGRRSRGDGSTEYVFNTDAGQEGCVARVDCELCSYKTASFA